MQFDRVADEARRQNHWFVKAIFEIEAGEGTYPGGVVMFDRPAMRKDEFTSHLSFGTASFVIAEFGRITFQHGHYDLGEIEAVNDFATRIEKGR